MRFAQMLDKVAEEIKAPPLLPAGTYHVRCTKAAEMSEVKGKDGTLYDKVTISMAVVGPIEVDEIALQEFGKVSGYNLRQEFLFNTDPDEQLRRDQTTFALSNFLKALGTFEDGMTLKEGLVACANGQAAAEVGHRPDPNDSQRFYTEIKRVTAL